MKSIVLVAFVVFLVALGETSGADRQQLVKNVEQVQAKLKTFVDTIVIGTKKNKDEKIQDAKEVSEGVEKCVTGPANEMTKFVVESYTALYEELNKKFTNAIQVLKDPNSKGLELLMAEKLAANPNLSCGRALQDLRLLKILPVTMKLAEKIEACQQY